MRARQQLIVRQFGDRIQRRRDDFDLAIGIEVRERHLRTRLGPDVPQEAIRHAPGRSALIREVLAPSASAVPLVDARQEGRDDLAQLGEHLACAGPDFL